MKKNFLKSLTIVVFTLCLLFIMTKSILAAPRIKFDQTSFGFGKVVQGKSITHVYKFKNIGDVPLTIKKVRAG